MGDHLPSYDRFHRFEDARAYATVQGAAAQYNASFTNNLCRAFGKTMQTVQWVVDPSRENSYFVSFCLKEKSANTARILEEGQEVRINHECSDGPSIKAIVVDTLTIPHGGTHLLSCTVAEGIDVRSTNPSFNQDGVWSVAYIHIENPDNVIKNRLNALQKLIEHTIPPRHARKSKRRIDDDTNSTLLQAHGHKGEVNDDDENAGDDSGEPQPALLFKKPSKPQLDFDYSNQLAILLGNSIPKYWSFNIFDGVSKEDVARITAKCTEVEREQLLKFGGSIPCGVLPIIGPPGVGKTISLCVLAELQLAARRSILCTASQNSAVGNFMQRFKRELGPDVDKDYLIVRMWSTWMEYRVCMSATDRMYVESLKSQPPTSRHGRLYNLEESLAGKFLMLCDVLPTENKTLLALRGRFRELVDEFKFRHHGIEQNDHKGMDGRDFHNGITTALYAILELANFVGTTLTQCGTDLGAVALRSSGFCIVDECCAATEIEILQGWKGNTPVALGGDSKQLPPTVLVENVKNSNGDPYSCFVSQSKYTLSERLLFNGWPYWKLGTQLRICPGGWDMTCEVLYEDTPRYGQQTLANFPLAATFESWLTTLTPHRCKNNDRLSLAPSPSSMVYPVFFHVANSFCYRDPRGVGRRNTQFVQVCLGKLLDLIQHSNGTVKMKDIVVIVPYLAQRELYLEAKLKDSHNRFEDLQISTASTFHGFERELAVFDLTVASNVGKSVGFVADRRRLSVSTTRHRSALMIIGDVFTFDFEATAPEHGSTETADLNNDANAPGWDTTGKAWTGGCANDEENADAAEEDVVEEEEEKKQQDKDVTHLQSLLKWCMDHKRIFVQDSAVLAANGSETFIKQFTAEEVKAEQAKWEAHLENNPQPDPEEVLQMLANSQTAQASVAPLAIPVTGEASLPAASSPGDLPVVSPAAEIPAVSPAAEISAVSPPVSPRASSEPVEIPPVSPPVSPPTSSEPVEIPAVSPVQGTNDGIPFLTCYPGSFIKANVDAMMGLVQYQSEFNLLNFLPLRAFHKKLVKFMARPMKFDEFAYEIFLAMKSCNPYFSPSDCLLYVTELCLDIDDLDYEDAYSPLIQQSALASRLPVVSAPVSSSAMQPIVDAADSCTSTQIPPSLSPEEESRSPVAGLSASAQTPPPPPAEGSRAPVEPSLVPVIQAHVPAVGSAIPTQPARVPAVGSAVPTQPARAPAVGSAIPTQQARAPAVGLAVPTQQARAPAVGSAVLTNAAPAQQQPAGNQLSYRQSRKLHGPDDWEADSIKRVMEQASNPPSEPPNEHDPKISWGVLDQEIPYSDPWAE
jgi:hypothetical protein